MHGLCSPEKTLQVTVVACLPHLACGLGAWEMGLPWRYPHRLGLHSRLWGWHRWLGEPSCLFSHLFRRPWGSYLCFLVYF